MPQYNPTSPEPYKISRSKIDLFVQCPRCFWLEQVKGIRRPSGPGFALNIAVDHLLKLEFDIHRAKGEKHPLQEQYGIDARPVHHEKLDLWRHNFTGIRTLHTQTNLLIFGAIDDLWINSKNEYIVVDYKATAKEGVVDKLGDEPWHHAYRRQIEIYQWLLRQNGFKVSSTGYFVYCNGKKDKKAFDAKLEFDIKLIAYKGDDSWVDNTIYELHKCLNSNKQPAAGENCEWCKYTKAMGDLTTKSK